MFFIKGLLKYFEYFGISFKVINKETKICVYKEICLRKLIKCKKVFFVLIQTTFFIQTKFFILKRFLGMSVFTMNASHAASVNNLLAIKTTMSSWKDQGFIGLLIFFLEF